MVVLREEFVASTQEPLVTIVLNQLLYWTQRVKDFDLLLEEERFITRIVIPPLDMAGSIKQLMI